MSLRLIELKKSIVAITLVMFLGNLQAGWLDKNLDKIKKAKELLNSAQKYEKEDEPKKDDQKKEDPKKEENSKQNKNAKDTQSSQTNKKPKQQQSNKKPSSKTNKNDNSLIYGEVVNIPLSNNGTLKTLTLPVYKGVLMSLGKSYPVSLEKLQKKTGMRISQLKREVWAINKERTNNYYLYQKLYAIKLSYKTLNKKKLKQLLLKPSSLAGTNEEITLLISWKNMVNYLAVMALSDASYAKYFCGSKKCNIDHDRVTQQKYVTTNLPYWGGLSNKNEFKKRKLIKEFVDNEFTEIVEWSKQHTFHQEEYVLGEMILPHYNFQKGYFDLKLRIDPAVLGNDKIVDNHVVMSEDKAQALVKKHKNNRLYYLYKVTSSISKNSYVHKTKNMAPYRLTYDFKVNSNPVEFFWNTELTNKWLDIPISSRKLNKGGTAKSLTQGAGGLSKQMECSTTARKHGRSSPIFKFAAICSRACQKAEKQLLYSQYDPNSAIDPQPDIDQCNTRYDEFKAAVAAETKAIAKDGNKPKSKERHLGDVVGILTKRYRKLYLQTANKDFDICKDRQGMFIVNLGHTREDRMKLQKIRVGARVKLIGVTWTTNKQGFSIGCRAADIEMAE